MKTFITILSGVLLMSALSASAQSNTGNLKTNKKTAKKTAASKVQQGSTPVANQSLTVTANVSVPDSAQTPTTMTGAVANATGNAAATVQNVASYIPGSASGTVQNVAGTVQAVAGVVQDGAALVKRLFHKKKKDQQPAPQAPQQTQPQQPADTQTQPAPVQQ